MIINRTDAANTTDAIVRQQSDTAAKVPSNVKTDIKAPVQSGGGEDPVSEKAIKDAVEKVNKAISGSSRSFQYSIHEKTKDIIVKVIDTDSNEVIREIPPRKILDLVASLMEMAGILIDERR